MDLRDRAFDGAPRSGLTPEDPVAVGAYRLVARLGAGGMGVVYLAASRGGSQVAVKVMHPRLRDDPRLRARFGREIAAHRLVNVPGTVRVLEGAPDDDVPFLVTEFVDAPSLGRSVGLRGALAPGELRVMLSGLAETLAAMHALGYAHRDLKPENVLLGATGPRLLDFGVVGSESDDSLTEAGCAVGTPGWPTPEQVRGLPQVPASDVFALGALAVFAATGDGPFGTGTAAVVAHRLLGQPPCLGGLPADLQPLAADMLELDAARRPTAGAVLANLAGPGRAPTGTTDAIRPSERLPPKARHLLRLPSVGLPPVPANAGRRRVLLATGSAASVLLVVSVVAFLPRGHAVGAVTAGTAPAGLAVRPTGTTQATGSAAPPPTTPRPGKATVRVPVAVPLSSRRPAPTFRTLAATPAARLASTPRVLTPATLRVRATSPAPRPAPTRTTARPSASPTHGSGRSETTGGDTATWTDRATGGGTRGPTVPAHLSVQIACRAHGLRLANGNDWWYLIRSSPWSLGYWASADAFYNNGATSGSLVKTPFVDPAVPAC